MPAIVAPRKTSRETRRSELWVVSCELNAGDDTGGGPFVLFTTDNLSLSPEHSRQAIRFLAGGQTADHGEGVEVDRRDDVGVGGSNPGASSVGGDEQADGN